MDDLESDLSTALKRERNFRTVFDGLLTGGCWSACVELTAGAELSESRSC